VSKKAKAAAAPAAAPEPAPSTAPEAAPAPAGHPLLQRRLWLPLAILVAAVNVPFVHLALRGVPAATRTVPLSDDFSAPLNMEDWWASGGHWRTVNGWL
jgi:hypothetical protein